MIPLERGGAVNRLEEAVVEAPVETEESATPNGGVTSERKTAPTTSEAAIAEPCTRAPDDHDLDRYPAGATGPGAERRSPGRGAAGNRPGGRDPDLAPGRAVDRGTGLGRQLES